MMSNLINVLDTQSGDQLLFPKRSTIRIVCAICDKGYTRKRTLRIHFAIRHGHTQNTTPNLFFSCSICERPFENKRHLSNHFRAHDITNPHFDYKPYQCITCGKEFAESGNLKCHYTIHSNNRPYECKYCNSSFKLPRALRDHVKRCHKYPKVPYGCVFCGKYFTDRGRLAMHINETELIKHSGALLECSICGQNDFTGKAVLTSHILNHSTKESKFRKCSICGLKLGRIEQFINHIQTHKTVENSALNFRCYLCHEIFLSLQDVYNHQLTIHNCKELLWKQWLCNICGKPFIIKYQMLQHMIVHRKDKQFECSYCNRRLKCKLSIIDHLRYHTGLGFKCCICGDCFSTKSLLRRHNLIHSKLKKYECCQCGTQFTLKFIMTNHIIRFHSKRKLEFGCSKCSKLFKCKSSLLQHMLKHIGSVPSWKCHICGKILSESRSLKRHNIVHSKIKKYQCNQCGLRFAYRFGMTAHLRLRQCRKLIKKIYN